MECGTQATLLQCWSLFPLKKVTRANIVGWYMPGKYMVKNLFPLLATKDRWYKSSCCACKMA